MNKAVIGLQWGDEGKGKVVDLLTENAYLGLFLVVIVLALFLKPKLLATTILNKDSC